jgi:hypothetical protein
MNSKSVFSFPVIPAKAETQGPQTATLDALDPRFRGGDGRVYRGGR